MAQRSQYHTSRCSGSSAHAFRHIAGAFQPAGINAG